jgi:2-keto-3-deoxy-L-rhamnonate aldolase RhmA
MPSLPSIKQRLNSGERLNGCFIEMFSPIAAEIVAGSGYDTVLIDLEHGPGSYTEAIAMMQAVHQYHCPAIIRSTSATTGDIKRTLDIGPQGIMVPMINTRQDALDVISDCHYAPMGRRSSARPIIRATEYGNSADDYERYLAEDFLLIVQIESAEAVQNVEQIAAVDGVDMLFIGPVDLSASLGKMGDYESDQFNRAFEKTVLAAGDAGKLLGTIPIPGRDAAHLYGQGFDLVLSGCDSMLLKSAAEENVGEMNRAAK